MSKEGHLTNLFTQEMIEIAVQLWFRSSISLIDVRNYVLEPDNPLEKYRMPTSMFIFTQGGQASVTLNHISYQSGRFGLFHGGKGTELSICPMDARMETYMVLYKAETAPFYRRDIHRLLDQLNPFIQLFGFAPANPLYYMDKIQSLYKSWNVNVVSDQVYAKGLLYQLVHEVYKELEHGMVRLVEPDFVDSIKRYLDQNYMEQVSIQSLIDMLPVSRSQLVRLFKKRERKSFQRYLNERRVEAAKQYLQSTSATIQEVALGCGFGDELNLQRMFKKYVQMTPSEYRLKVMLNMDVYDVDNDSHYPYNEIGLQNAAEFKGDGELSMFGQIRSKEIILAAAMSLMLLLSACSSTAPANNSASASPAPAQTQTQAAESTQPEGTEVREQTRMIKTDQGNVEVPTDPKRIVYLVGNNVGDILPFGKTVVGVDIYGDPSKRPESWKQQWGQHVEGVKVVPGKDLEGIMALEPDLIIGSPTWASSSPEQLGKIAPTIFYNEMASLEERMTFFGEVFGMPERAEELIAEYNSKAEAAKQRLKEANLNSKKIVFLQGVEEGEPGLQGDKTRGIIYEDLGMSAPELVENEFFNRKNPKTEGYYAPISLEVIGKYLNEADIIAYTNFGTDADELKKQLSEVEIWNSLPAVKAGNVMLYSVSDTLSDYDYASRIVSLDTFVSALLELPIAKK